MKYIFIFVSILLGLSGQAQSKKEQIEILRSRFDSLRTAMDAMIRTKNARWDSLRAVAESQRNFLGDKVKELTVKVADLEKQKSVLTAETKDLFSRMQLKQSECDALTAKFGALTLKFDALTLKFDALTKVEAAKSTELEKVRARFNFKLDSLHLMIKKLQDSLMKISNSPVAAGEAGVQQKFGFHIPGDELYRAALLTSESTCPMSAGGYGQDDVMPIGFSPDRCFYYLRIENDGMENYGAPQLFTICANAQEEQNIPVPKFEFQLFDESAEAYNNFLIKKLEVILADLVYQKKIDTHVDWKMTESLILPPKFPFEKLVEIKGQKSTRYSAKRRNGETKFIKQFEVLSYTNPQDPDIGGEDINGEYVGYIKSAMDDTILLVFRSIAYSVGFENANQCSYEFMVLTK